MNEGTAGALLQLVSSRRGHFRLESGHHGGLWLDLDPLFAEPHRVEPLAAALTNALRPYAVAGVCGPLVGGAFLAQLVARLLAVEFCFTERVPASPTGGLYEMRYRLPRAFTARVRGKRLAIVDDVMSAGSALRGTYEELQTHGAAPVVVGALLVLGSAGAGFFAERGVPVEAVARDDFDLWLPADCPLCAAGLSLEDMAAAGAQRTAAAGERSASDRTELVNLYGANYSRFASPLYEEIRREAFDEDLGSNSWLTPQEHVWVVAALGLAPGASALDVACGPGGPALRLARATAAQVTGVDIHEQAIEQARAMASRDGLAERARFELVDAAGPLPFSSGSFDAVLCIDAIQHLPDRRKVLSEWSRLLRPRGRLLFTDPAVVTGPVSKEELAVRSSIGFYLFMPDGENEEILRDLGFDVLETKDVTASVELVARARREARQAREPELLRIEGEDTFEGQQRFLRMAETLASERRLSRFLYLAERAFEPEERNHAR